ncbi:MAG: DUF3156 family protein [Thermoleophilia bacterium]|nr:DUF3156 family protein [Thermoleophilia bacterium]
MLGRARAAAARTLRATTEVWSRAGFRPDGREGGLERVVARDGERFRLRMAPQGRIFGGSYALEVSPEVFSLPATGGLAARGRGLFRLRAVAFRPRRRDGESARLAAWLGSDARLQRALRGVHFEAVRVDPDGRPVIRHMGGSVVWLLFPPLVRPVPFAPEQVEPVVAALRAFERGAGRGAPRAERAR